MAILTRTKWNELIAATRAKVLECSPEADVSELVAVEANHVWAKEDLTKVMGRLRAIRSACEEFFEFTDYAPTTDTIITDLWRQRMITEIELALEQECCDNDCWTVNFSVEDGFELTVGESVIVINEGGDLELTGVGCVHGEDEAAAEAAAGAQLENIIKQFYGAILATKLDSVSGTANLILPVLPQEGCAGCL
jgi:hypothetical protein